MLYRLEDIMIVASVLSTDDQLPCRDQAVVDGLCLANSVMQPLWLVILSINTAAAGSLLPLPHGMDTWALRRYGLTQQ